MSEPAQPTAPPETIAEEVSRRAQRLMLAENAFAHCIGATLSGVFLTSMIKAMGGGIHELGAALAAGHVGAIGMLLTNPVLNRIGSRRKLCLATLAVVRSIRIVIGALPVLIWLGVDRTTLVWPMVAAILASAVFGMSAEVSRRSWISSFVPVSQRGRFFGRRVVIGSLTAMAITLAGGLALDHFFPGSAGDPRGLWRERLTGLCLLAGLGGLMGWIGWGLLWRTPEPPMRPPRRRTSILESWALPWRHPRFRPLMIVGAASALATGVCAGYFQKYMLDDVGMSLFWVAAVDAVGELVAVAGAPLYGLWADKTGARRILHVSMICKGFFPALWIFVSPSTWPLAFAVVLIRTFNSAGQIAWIRLTLDLAPARNQAAFLAMQQTVMSAGHAVSTYAAGVVAGWLVIHPLTLGGRQIIPLHVLFVTSAALRLCCVPLLRFVRPPRRALGQAPPPGA